MLARAGRPSSAAPEKVYVNYTYTRHGRLEFDADEWHNARNTERQQMVEQAVGEAFDNDFELYGGQGIAECVDWGDLDYTTTSRAVLRAEWEAEAIEAAIRAYADIDEHDEWPDGGSYSASVSGVLGREAVGHLCCSSLLGSSSAWRSMTFHSPFSRR
jgi:hypothetical protein